MQEVIRPSGGWRKSSYSGTGDNCVEVKVLDHGGIGVRDSKNPDGDVLRFGGKEWGLFLAEIKVGRL